MGVTNLRTEAGADATFNVVTRDQVGCFYSAPNKASLRSPMFAEHDEALLWSPLQHFILPAAPWGPWELGLGLFIAGERLGRDHFNEA